MAFANVFMYSVTVAMTLVTVGPRLVVIVLPIEENVSLIFVPIVVKVSPIDVPHSFILSTALAMKDAMPAMVVVRAFVITTKASLIPSFSPKTAFKSSHA